MKFTLLSRGTLGEASKGESAFAACLEEFGGGPDDPISLSIGGLWSCSFVEL
jgi:hypothetical protein